MFKGLCLRVMICLPTNGLMQKVSDRAQPLTCEILAGSLKRYLNSEGWDQSIFSGCVINPSFFAAFESFLS